MRIFFLLVLALCSCQPSEPCRKAQQLRINIQKDPVTLDPAKARDLSDVTLCRMLFEGLTRISKQGDAELALAHTVAVSPDGLTYTFRLNKAHWSNGERITSADFADRWRQTLAPAFPSDVAYQLYAIKHGRQVKLGALAPDSLGVETPDAETLVVHLEQPTPYFLDLCTMPSYFPASRSASNGPFLLKEWVHQDHLRLEKNPSYWQTNSVGLEAIDCVMVPPDTELRMFEEGQLDWAGSPLSVLPIDAIGSLKAKGTFQQSPLAGTYFLRLNVEKGPLSNPALRQALFAAIDRESLVEHLLQGGQKPAQSLVPPEMGLPLPRAIAGVHRQFPREEITLSFKAADSNVAIAQAIQEAWEKKLGLRVHLNAVEPKVYYQKLREGEFEVAAGSWLADVNDPVNFLELFKFKQGGANHTGWEHPRYVECLNRAEVCTDLEERRRHLSEAEAILMAEMPIVPVFHYAMNYLQQPGMQEVVLSPLGQIDFRQAHWEAR